jgi:hypothetical protein
MKFIIGKSKPKKKEGYYLKFTWMSGDADAYDTTEEGPIHEHEFEELSALIDWIERYMNFDHNSKCDKSYKVLDDYKHFVTGYLPKMQRSTLAIEWESDVCSDGQFDAWLDEYMIYYIDKDGNEFSVKVEK